MATNGGHPGRILIVLGVLMAALVGLMALSGTWTPRLGLDLRGGTTVTLTASNTEGGGAPTPESLALARNIIEQRVNGLGVGEAEVTTAGDRQVIVSVPNVQRDELVEQVGRTAILRFRAVYAAEEVAPPPAAEPPGGATAEPTPAPSEEASPTPSGNNRPLPQLPTAPPGPVVNCSEEAPGTPPDQAVDWSPSATCQAQFAEFTCDEPQTDIPDQPLFSCDEAGTAKYLLGPTLIDGTSLTGATAGVPQNDVQWVVNLDFDATGAEAFERATGALASRGEPNNRFAIVLDGETISAPSVNQAIAGGRAEISGSFTQESATQLANVLKYGALPLTFEVSEVSNVSATLGGDQLEAGLIAGAIGLALVVAFCFLYYRGLGIVVVTSLVVAAAITYACMVLLGSSVGFALNLAGIAGAVVAIGVTADSFVIYFERIRDEVREGRSLRTAVESGWLRARRTVLIADAVSMLSAIVLFVLAIGSVRGFAFTLGLTTLIDVLVVFWFTKPLLTLLARTRFFGGGHKLSGLDPEHLGVKALPGVRRRPAAAAATRTARPTALVEEV